MSEWSVSEVETLREAYSAWPPDYSRFPGRSRASIHVKAYRLGLTRGRAESRPYLDVTPTEWAYLAGILDSDGFIYNGTNRIIGIVNTDERLVAWIEERFPGCRVTTIARNGKWGTKPIFQVRWTRKHFGVALLDGVIPYLIVKRDKAVEMMRKFNALT